MLRAEIEAVTAHAIRTAVALDITATNLSIYPRPFRMSWYPPTKRELEAAGKSIRNKQNPKASFPIPGVPADDDYALSETLVRVLAVLADSCPQEGDEIAIPKEGEPKEGIFFGSTLARTMVKSFEDGTTHKIGFNIMGAALAIACYSARNKGKGTDLLDRIAGDLAEHCDLDLYNQTELLGFSTLFESVILDSPYCPDHLLAFVETQDLGYRAEALEKLREIASKNVSEEYLETVADSIGIGTVGGPYDAHEYAVCQAFAYMARVISESGSGLFTSNPKECLREICGSQFSLKTLMPLFGILVVLSERPATVGKVPKIPPNPFTTMFKLVIPTKLIHQTQYESDIAEALKYI